MAQTPPPLPTAPQVGAPATKTANRACLIVVITVMCMCVVLGFIAFRFAGNVMNQVRATAQCMAMFDLTDKAIIAYASDHDGKFPAAATWQDDVQPYYDRLYAKLTSKSSSDQLPEGFLPPAAGQPMECRWEGQKTGITYNVEIAGKRVDSFKSPETTAVVFETPNTGRNLADKYVEKPKAKAPKLMYNERDWFAFYIKGNKNPFETTGTTRVSVEVTPEDALDKSADKQKRGAGKPESGEQ